MRTIPVVLLGLALSLLASVTRAQSSELPALREFRIYFLHLANIDAAADKADAEGASGDTAAWRRFEQEKAGLNETEAALLKDVAFRCNRALEEGGQAPMAVVRQAVDELRAVLAPAAFEAVSERIRTFLRPAITNLPAAVQGDDDEDEIPVDVEVFTGQSVSVYSLLFKLQDGHYMAQCGTAPNDADTRNLYAGGVTMICELRGGDLPAPIQVPCGSSPSSTTCSGTYPPGTPTYNRWLTATHGLRMKLFVGACYSPVPLYDDPLFFCRTGRLAPNFFEDGDVFPYEGGVPTCWDPEGAPSVCKIATSHSASISFIEINPSASVAYPGGTVKFGTWMPAIWSTDGPGTIDNTGLYRAPATILSEQAVTVRGCDASAPGDCDTATVTLKPLQVQIAPSPVEVLPKGKTTLTATLVPAVPGQAVVWSMTPDLGHLFFSGNTATYTAPAYDELAGNTEITVTACLSPATSVCNSAKVIVPKLLFTITAPKTKLELNETVQVTAFLQGSNVQRQITWKDPVAGTLSVINAADPFIRLYKAPGSPAYSETVIEACLVESPAFCAQLPLDLPEPLNLYSFTPGTGRWQAGTLTDFTITGTGFRPGMQISMGGLEVTVTSMTETVIQGKVRILAAATGVPLRLAIVYPDGNPGSITWSPREAEPATVAVSPGTAQVPGGGSRGFDSVCLTSTALPCTSQEIPSWTTSQGSITPTGLHATYTAPASVASESQATVTACWNYGEESKCGFAAVSLLPNGPIVSVTPKTASVRPGETKQFTAQVTNDPNTAVTWSIQPQIGTITQGGLYTAPSTFGGAATVTVTAASVANSSRKDTATVTLVPASLTLTSTPSPAVADIGTTITWTATASGGTPPYQYAVFRRKSGGSWIPALDNPSWQSGNVLSWATAAADAGVWEIRIGVRDATTPVNAPVLHDPGSVRVKVPLSYTCPPPEAKVVNSGTPVVWTINVSGGTPPYQFAFFRRRQGTMPWTPSVSTPAWQTSNVHSWTPAAGDAGIWEFYVWIKDADTPPSQNVYGYAIGCNLGTVEVGVQLTVTSTPSPAAAYHSNPLAWTATGSGGTGTGRQYALFRLKAGTSNWIPSPSAPSWQPGNILSWTPGPADVGTWTIVIWFKDSSTPADANGYGFGAYHNAGAVQVYAHPAVSGTGSPSSADHGTTISWTATGSGGIGSAKQYALFRKRAGTSSWTPAVTNPSWQTGNVLSWTPGSGDVGTWEIVIWMKDANTPSTMNGYGFAAYYNAGPVEVTAPVYQDHAPIGWVDGVNNQDIWGWACDPDYPQESNRVDLWTTSWQYLGQADAYFWSSSPINSACGGGSAHYFSFHHGGSIPSGTQFRVWSIDLPYATPGNDNRPIGGNNATGDGTVFVMP